MGDPSSSSANGDSGIFAKIRQALGLEPSDPSLRTQLEEAIDEHEGDGPDNEAEGDLSPLERQMLRNLLHFGERTADDVCVPRADIIAVAESASFDELVALIVEAEHSRIPVYRDSLDTVIGMIHIRDVFRILASGEERPKGFDHLIREPIYVPETMGALDLLAEMRTKRMHLAIVLDEYSGTEGIVTIEDLVEEIVGEIEDEHDDAPAALLVDLGQGLWEADARAELEDVAETIDTRLGEIDEDVDTLGGLAFVLAGHVPQPGETVEHPSGWKLEVTEGDAKKVLRMKLHAPPPDPEVIMPI